MYVYQVMQWLSLVHQYLLMEPISTFFGDIGTQTNANDIVKSVIMMIDHDQ